MASQLTIILWTDHPADPSLASDLAAQAAAQVFRSSSMQAAVVSATSVDIQVHDIEAAVAAFAETPEPTAVVTTEVPAAPAVVEPASPEVVPADVDPPAVPEGTTAASAGLVSVPVPDPATPLVDSDEHMAVLVKLFEGLTDEQKAQLDSEVQTMEDAHAALETIYAPLVAASAIDAEARPTDHEAPPA